MSKNKLKNIKVEETKDTIPSFLKSNYIIYAVLFMIMALSFYFRGIVPWEATFANGITVFATDDAVYHMRLAENLIANFPHRLTYDAFTLYPYGSVLSWGIFYDLIIGMFALIFGINNLNMIGALIPAIMGALIVIPVYFIGTELLNKKAGLCGAFIITVLPGAFFQRSLLGFTDHHVAETLLTTFFMMFFILAFNRAVKDISIKEFMASPIFYITKTPLKHAALSGIFLGLYILTWTTGLLFGGIVAIFIVLQIFINYIKNKSNSPLILITTLVFGISSLMIIPFVEMQNGFAVVFYSPAHILSLMAIIIVSLYLNFISIKMKKTESSVFKFIGISIVSFVGIFILIQILIPSFFFSTFGSLNVLFGEKTGGGLTIGEAAPTTMSVINSIFGLNTTFAFLAIILLTVVYFSTVKNEKILIVIIWYIFILVLLFAQNRWAYYFAANIAIMSGFLCGYVLDYVGKWKNIKSLNAWNITSLVVVIFFIGFYPTDSSPYTVASQIGVNGVVSGGFYEWYESMTWMRNNTPDTGLDYYGTYERPESGKPYPYPDTAYGVMSWWDYGHVITYWAHRIPNSNPFQSGIGGTSSHVAGASTFLIAPTEEEANTVLEKLGVNGKSGAKYVVSSAYMAYAIQPVFAEWDGTNTDYFQQVRTSQGTQILPSGKFYNTMESKLHIFDTNGLKYYRLIHESAPNPYVSGGAQEIGYKEIYNGLINKNNPIPMENSGFVKIFEVVKGANIVGTIPPNTLITVENDIVTNINRTIHYKQTTTSDANGYFTLTVPYSTLGAIEGETQFDTKMAGKYKLTFDDKYASFDINEQDVLDGKTLNIG